MKQITLPTHLKLRYHGVTAPLTESGLDVTLNASLQREIDLLEGKFSRARNRMNKLKYRSEIATLHSKMRLI